MTTPKPPAPPVDEALQQRVARALRQAGETAYGNTPFYNALAAVVLAELAPELALLADLTEARLHGAYTYCPQLVGHVSTTAFAKKINEKLTAVAQRNEAVQHANEQQQRAGRAEAALDRVRKLADRWDRDAPPPGNRPLTELRTALDTPTQETP